MSEANTLFEIDRELDSLLDQIEEEAEENGTASPELLERFQQFCQAESDKVDRIGRFLRLAWQFASKTPPWTTCAKCWRHSARRALSIPLLSRLPC